MLFLILLLGAAGSGPGMIPACLPDWAGGACYGRIAYSANTTLEANLNSSGNIVVEKGVTLDANGFYIITSGILTNNGIIISGISDDKAEIDQQGMPLPLSYGGSGGGGGGGNNYGACVDASSGADGGSTTASAGTGGNSPSGIGGHGSPGGSGNSAFLPVLSNPLIELFSYEGIQNFIEGAGGGGGSQEYQNTCRAVYGATGSNATYGIYIQAYSIDNSNGYIDAQGSQGNAAIAGGAGGGSGGGTIILAYGKYLSLGNYDVSGGEGGSGSNLVPGGSGGNGLLLVYNYSEPPLNATMPNLPKSVTLSISNATIDQGQGIFFTANVIGGIPPYIYNFTITSESNVVYAFNSAGSSSGSWAYEPVIGSYASSVAATDSNPYTVNSILQNFTVNADPNLNVTYNYSVVAGQNAMVFARANGGTMPYRFNWSADYGNSSVARAEKDGANYSIISFLASNSGSYRIILKATDAENFSVLSNISINATEPNEPSHNASHVSVTSYSSGGGSGGGGEGGSSRPLIQEDYPNYTVTNVQQYGSFQIVFCNHLDSVYDNFITPNSTGITVNGTAYTIAVNETEDVGTDCHVKLINVSYVPIMHTVALGFFVSKPQTAYAVINSTTIPTRSSTASSSSSSSTVSTAYSTTIPFVIKQKQQADGKYGIPAYAYVAAGIAIASIMLLNAVLLRRRSLS